MSNLIRDLSDSSMQFSGRGKWGHRPKLVGETSRGWVSMFRIDISYHHRENLYYHSYITNFEEVGARFYIRETGSYILGMVCTFGPGDRKVKIPATERVVWIQGTVQSSHANYSRTVVRRLRQTPLFAFTTGVCSLIGLNGTVTVFLFSPWCICCLSLKLSGWWHRNWRTYKMQTYYSCYCFLYVTLCFTSIRYKSYNRVFLEIPAMY